MCVIRDRKEERVGRPRDLLSLLYLYDDILKFETRSNFVFTMKGKFSVGILVDHETAQKDRV